jgi:hypothetical protein
MMLRYEYINKEWIVSPTARGIYRISAGLSLALLGFWWIALSEGIPPQIQPMVRPLVFVGVLGAGTTFVGMEYFLFRFDDSHPLKQILWFVVMLLACSDHLSTVSSFIHGQRCSKKYVGSNRAMCREIDALSVQFSRRYGC